VMFDSALFHKTDDFRFKKVRARNHKSAHQNENAPLPSTLGFAPTSRHTSAVEGV